MRLLTTVRAPSAGERWVGFFYDGDARAAAQQSKSVHTGCGSFRIGPRVHGNSRDEVLSLLQSTKPGTAPSVTLKTAGHVRPAKQEVSDEVKEARRLLKEDAEARRAGAVGHVYCVRERPLPTEQLVYGEYTNVVKVGHTYVTPPPARCAGLQTGNPRELVMVAFKPGSEVKEKGLHAKFIELNVLGEWFTLTDDIKSEFDL